MTERAHTGAEDLKPLTSLRFVAAMMIVVLHAQLYFSWPWLTHAPNSLLDGVSFFFVLSGFILSHVYMSKPFPGYREFLAARFARLWPVHIFSILLLACIVPHNSMTLDGPGIFSKWVTLALNLTLTQSIVPFKAYTFGWNSVSWSISTEAFFYMAFPFLLRDIRKTWCRALGASVLCAIMLCVLVGISGIRFDGNENQISSVSILYTNPLTRGFEFVLGMATWVLWDRYIRHRTLSVACWTAIEIGAVSCAAFLLWVLSNHFPTISNAVARELFGLTGSCWIFSALIAAMAPGRGLLGRALSMRIPVFMGEISFSIYMLHQILMKAAVARFPVASIHTPEFLIALLLVASASYLMIERPARTLILRLIERNRRHVCAISA